MRDSLGGIPILAIVTLFIVIALSYVAFNVNYTKAFRMKNKAIEILQKYNGGEKCKGISECKQELKNYAESIGYSTGGLDCSIFGNANGNIENLICYTEKSSDYYSIAEKKANGIIIDGKETFYNRVYAKINVDLPIIKKLVTSVSYFYVSGSTESIER